MGSYWEARYEYVWPEVNSTVDRKSCIAMTNSDGKQKAMLVFWPAIRCNKTGYDGVEEVWFAPKARVLAYRSLE
ncbi:hypothetical protein AC578_3135 [Pseudocercospora eumusae]|uniref:Uncharacterized protein n=1 Tax=Pseudocercospora eumusae TaxID=321146 RepID=A0A139H6H1_9PEZI|nr:hypothetical protein AC578_3135 [Pseudocercospora eumusae]